MPELHLDPKRTAVLCMDYQTHVVGTAAKDDAEGLLARANKVLAAARAAKALVGYVVVGFRPGLPEVSPRNQSFSTVRTRSPGFLAGEGAQIHPAVLPQEGDVTVTKHRVSAFAGTDLEMILRAKDIDTLVLMGLSTSGVVLSTVRYAADADYRLVVVRDCCSDTDPLVHQCLMEKVFPRQTTVATAEEVCAQLGAR